MKLCICGKGGCGKSTVVSLLAGGFTGIGKKVVVLDSDESNTGLYRMLGLKKPPSPLMELFGGKKSIQAGMRSRFADGEKESAMSLVDIVKMNNGSIPSEYLESGNGISLLVTGKVHNALEGCACPMGSVTREIVGNFVLCDDEVMLVDTEAGIEHFGRGIEAGADCVVAIVEPSLESITLANTIRQLTQGSGALFSGVIVNKPASPRQKDHVVSLLEGDEHRILGILDFLPTLQQAGLEGRPLKGIFPADLAESVVRGIVATHTEPRS